MRSSASWLPQTSEASQVCVKFRAATADASTEPYDDETGEGHRPERYTRVGKLAAGDCLENAVRCVPDAAGASGAAPVAGTGVAARGGRRGAA
jgi:hypothetical protein